MNYRYRQIISKAFVCFLATAMLFNAIFACAPVITAVPASPPATAFVQTSLTSFEKTPYKGDGSKYAFTMTNERDRQWEEDIVFVADTFLDFLYGHPKLSGRNVVTYERNFSSGRLLIQNNSEYASFYDEALRDTFIDEINRLILSIPMRNDREIVISLQKIAALLHDAHTLVGLLPDTFLGIFVGPLASEFGMEYGILFTRKEYESLLMSRLDGINGVPIEEIMERIRPLISYDCEINYQYRACSYSYLSNPDVLRYISVMGEEDAAVLSLTGMDGKAYEYTIKASSTDTWDWNDYVEYVSGTGNDSGDMGIYACRATNFIIYGTESYWFETVANGKTVFIRLNSCPRDEKMAAFFETAFSSVDDADLEKIIIDFRFNSGGDASLGGGFGKLLSLIQATDADVYVLINGTSISAGTFVPALLKRYAPKITLVGSPTGQGVRCFTYRTSVYHYLMPNSGIPFYCSNVFTDAWPDYDEPTLMPDVIVNQTFKDYINGIDSVLKYVLREDMR